jgi:hypothetical protein
MALWVGMKVNKFHSKAYLTIAYYSENFAGTSKQFNWFATVLCLGLVSLVSNSFWWGSPGIFLIHIKYHALNSCIISN